MAKSSKSDKEKGEVKTTSFVLKTIISRKLSVISAMEDISMAEIANEALSEYIFKWEKKNGEIAIK